MDDVRRSHNPPPIELVDRYLTGEATPEERAQVAAWIAEDARRESLGMLAQHGESRDSEVEAAWVRTARKIERQSGALRLLARTAETMRFSGGAVQVERASQERRTLSGRKAGWTQPPRGWLWAGAMTAVIIAMLFLAHQRPTHTNDISRRYATDLQQQAIVNLGDGSRVTLAPNSTLQIEHIGTTSRVLVLSDGEAYFEVAHASAIPFVVRSGTVTTRVLGTAFLIRHRAGDAHVHVAVMDGKVRVTNPVGASAAVTLTTGQVGDVTDSTTQVSRTDDFVSDAEWLNGRVVFHHTPVATVLQTVSRWYGYHFQYTDSTLGIRKVTMKVSMRSSAEALADLERVLEVNLSFRGDTITLVPQPVRPNRSAPRIRTYDVWTPNREVGR